MVLQARFFMVPVQLLTISHVFLISVTVLVESSGNEPLDLNLHDRKDYG